MNLFNIFSRVKPEQPTVSRRNFGFSGGVVVDENSSMMSSAFYRGVIYISTQISKLPWDIKDKDNKRLPDDKLFYMLNVSPNEEMTAMHFKLKLIQDAIIHGNGYAEIERTLDGRPMKLWPLNPKRVCPQRTPSGQLYYEVSGGDGDTVILSPNDLFIVRNFHTKDGIHGLGLVGYAMEILGISLGGDRFANSLYSNGGIPSGILSHEGTLSDEAYKRLEQSWKENYGGRKTGGTAILEEGVKYSTVSLAPDVLQFLESRQFNIIELARFLGLPPTKLFDSHSAKFNNIEHANLEVATDTLDAWARNLEGEADMKLLNGRRGGKRTELDLYSIFRGDMVTRSTYFKNMVSIAAMTPNQVRVKEGEAGYGTLGDRYLIATNNFTPADRLDEVIDSQIKSAEAKSKPQEPPKQQASVVDEALAEYLKKKALN